MVEYWFRYGVTEVFVDISDEVKVDKISTSYSGMKYDYSIISKIANEIVESNSVAIIFEYASSRELDLLKSLMAEIEARGSNRNKFKILVSSWRINPKTLEKEIGEALKPYRSNIIYPWNESKVEYNGVMVSRSIIDSQVRVYISTILPHGVLGFPSIQDSLKLSGWINDNMLNYENYWFKLRDELNFIGTCIVGENIYYGYLYEIEDECLENAEKNHTVKIDEEADILLVDGLGWPWDSTLEDSLHIVNLVKEGVREGGLIGLISECKEGLGSNIFIKALFSQILEEDVLGVKALKKVIELLGKKKLAFVTTIPRRILERTLNSKGFDTVQDFLTYALRMYSKQALVRIVDGAIWLVK